MTNCVYSLNIENYSWQKALLWGNFIEHCKKASQGNLGNRIVHALIAAIELLPIISQIVSLCEKLILASSTDKLISRYKVTLLSQLPGTIESQQKHPTYARQPLVPLPEKCQNLPIPLSSLAKKVKYFSENAIFYSYCSEGIFDEGWGCAWRAIQTCLSAYKISFSFEELFHLFGSFENLKLIYEDKYPREKLSNSKFAPYDLFNGWAEPFIGHMVMYLCNIQSALETVNGIPRNCNAPKSVFHNKSLDFSAFKQRLEHHFKAANPAPIMVDDGKYALNIVGMELDGLNTLLWIADPHIYFGVNKIIDKEKSPSGLYKVVLDDSGKQKSCSLYSEDDHQLINMFDLNSHLGLHFDSKPWMVLFPSN